MKHLLFALIMAAPVLARAEVLWTGDFETGDRSQWSRMFAAASSRITIATPPGDNNDSSHAARIELRASDTAIKLRTDGSVQANEAMANRSELVHAVMIGEGQEEWYRWQLYVPAEFDSRDDHTGGVVFAQWHHTGGGSPPILYVVENTRMRLVYCAAYGCSPAVDLWETPLERGRWYTFVQHVRWSSDKTKGLLELWVDGEPQMSRNVATLFRGYQNYLQSGQYRRPSNTTTTVLWIDGWMKATAKEDVLPPPPPPPPQPEEAQPEEAQPPVEQPAQTQQPQQQEPQVSLSPYDADAPVEVDAFSYSVVPPEGCTSAGPAALSLPLAAIVFLSRICRGRRRRG